VTLDFNLKSPPSPIIIEQNRYPSLSDPPAVNVMNHGPVEPSAPSLGVSTAEVMISPHNFLNVVPIVNLDNNLKFFGQDICVICNENFSREGEIRSLPCMHAFHGKCIYDLMAIGNQKTCPICRREYL
jgi:hypothetical protein